jgi:septal ring factor EnvC (AmiA/AmiB activator)
MTEAEVVERTTVSAEHVGGIDRTEVSLSPGVTVLRGRNATNRTSFLKAVMAACGSETAPLKGDADAGHVELALGDETYTRTLERDGGRVRTGGDPYLDDPTVADLFAFLLESNEARRAVARGDDLRELLMRPVDTEAIRADIRELEEEKRRLDGELDDLDELEDRLPELRAERERLEEEKAETEAELEAKREEIEAFERGVEETRAQRDEREDVVSELHDVQFDIDTQRESLERLREEREEAADRLADLPDTEDAADIESRLDRLRTERSELTARINELQRVVEFNENMLDGDTAIAEALHEDEDEGDVTDRLLPDDGTVCWTCGSEVAETDIESTLSSFRELLSEWVAERSELGAEIDDLESELDERRERREERERLEAKRERLAEEITEREAKLESLTEREAELEERVDELEETDDALLETHREANELEFEIDSLADDIADTEAEIERAETRLDERGRIEAEREAVSEDLAERRTRIESLESAAVERFNGHMAELLDVLGYENIERVWIERVETEVREGRQVVTKGRFDLHVVRTTEDGRAYEDTVEHLSESEREVIGLVFALAGYLVHDVHETVPFMVLDSLEAIDADRIARLVDYFEEYAPYLVVALLPEDADALDAAYERVEDI